MVTQTHTETMTLSDLRAQVQGSVLTPEHPGYARTHQGWNLSVQQHPAVIVVAANPADVSAAVRYARDNQLGVAVQSTGHGIMQPADGAVLIVTYLMNKVEINAEARTSWIEAGSLWKPVLEAAQAVGLAPLLGSSPYVGVVGYTLGGGMGWLARKYGLSADNVRSIEIVTPDGKLRRASASENSDLFWGLRGGGGNFGVVTALEINLYPVATIYGGILMYPIERLGAALHFFRAWTAKAPDELTASLTVVNFPPIPQVPEPLRGKKFVLLEMAFTGAPEWGAQLAHEWLDWAEPLQNTVRVMPFTEVGTISNDPVDPVAGFSTGELLDTLSDAAIDVIARTVSAPESPLTFVELRHGGGAIAKADRSANAIGNRDTAYYLRLGGGLPTPEARERADAFVGAFKRELRPYISGGMYLNFMDGQEAGQRTRDAYSAETYARLRDLKAKYDPANLFRFSFAIPVGDSGEGWRGAQS